MLSSNDYVAALDEIRVLVKQRHASGGAGLQRLKALAAAVAEYAAANRPRDAALSRDRGHDRLRPEDIDILPVSCVRRDLVSILRRQCRTLVTRRGVPVVVITPLVGSSSEASK